MTACHNLQCTVPAVMAIRTTASQQGLKTLIYWDETDAPQTAERLCSAHGKHLIEALARDLLPEQVST